MARDLKKARYRFKQLTADEKHIYINNLVELEHKLNGLGYDVFLTYGGLLAGIREKNLILHDKDIDIAIVSKAENNNYETLKKEIDSVYTTLPNHREITIPKPKDQWGRLRFTVYASMPPDEFKNMFYDVYLSFEDPSNQEHQCIYNYFPRMHVIGGDAVKRCYTSLPKDWIFPLKREGELGGHKFLVPNKYELCLETWYNDWKRPDDLYFTDLRIKDIMLHENSRIDKLKAKNTS